MKINKAKWIYIFLFLNLQPVLADEKLPAIRADSVIVDFLMAENMIDWLIYAKREPSAEKQKIKFMELVAPTSGCEAIISHWARFDSNWNVDAFYHFVAEHLGFVKTHKKLVDDKGELTRFAIRKKMWLAALQDTEQIRHLIEQLKTLDWNKNLRSNVKANLPPEIILDVNFHFVLFGASNAFSVNNSIGFDVLQLPLNEENNLELDDIFRTASHELHHSGFSLATEKYLANIKNIEYISLVGLMSAEGIATHLYQQPFERYLNRSVEETKINGIVGDWQTKVPRLPQMFQAAAEDINLGLLGQFGGKPLYKKWLDGYQGDAYILGTAMIRLIEQELGTEKVIQLIRDYRKLLSFYNMAANKANEKIAKDNMNQQNNFPGKRHYVFSRQLAQSVANFSGGTKN